MNWLFEGFNILKFLQKFAENLKMAFKQCDITAAAFKQCTAMHCTHNEYAKKSHWIMEPELVWIHIIFWNLDLLFPFVWYFSVTSCFTLTFFYLICLFLSLLVVFVWFPVLWLKMKWFVLFVTFDYVRLNFDKFEYICIIAFEV